MWKKLATGCCVVAALGVVAVVSMISMFPKVLGFVREEVGDELERQSIAAAWLAPAEGATPETIFPARVDEYRIESTAEGVSVPALGIDERGAHATYASDASRIDVHAFSVTKREADVGGRSSLDPRVAPRRILPGRADDESRDVGPGSWATRLPAIRVVPLASGEPRIPGGNGDRSDDRGDPFEDLSAEGPALRSESATFVIGEAEPPATQLPLEDTVSLDQVLDDVLLMALDPACESDQQELPGLKRAHGRRCRSTGLRDPKPPGSRRSRSVQVPGHHGFHVSRTPARRPRTRFRRPVSGRRRSRSP